MDPGGVAACLGRDAAGGGRLRCVVDERVLSERFADYAAHAARTPRMASRPACGSGASMACNDIRAATSSCARRVSAVEDTGEHLGLLGEFGLHQDQDAG